MKLNVVLTSILLSTPWAAFAATTPVRCWISGGGADMLNSQGQTIAHYDEGNSFIVDPGETTTLTSSNNPQQTVVVYPILKEDTLAHKGWYIRSNDCSSLMPLARDHIDPLEILAD